MPDQKNVPQFITPRIHLQKSQLTRNQIFVWRGKCGRETRRCYLTRTEKENKIRVNRRTWNQKDLSGPVNPPQANPSNHNISLLS